EERAQAGGGAGARPFGEPAGRVAAPQGAQGSGAGDRPRRGRPPHLRDRSARPRPDPRVAGPVLGSGARRLQGRGRASRRPAEESGEAAMSPSIRPAPVRKRIEVAAEPDLAFEVFAARIELWWPRTHSIGKPGRLDRIVIEPRAGGRWYGVDDDGAEC